MRINLPLFIVFEGIDGSGKTTISEMLYKYFLESGIDAVKGQEPTGGIWGKKIRDLLQNGGASAEMLLELFLNDRADDARDTIIPSLERNKAVIMDRYYFSNAAYQGAMGISPASIIEENRNRKFPEPDRVYLIDIDIDTALKRISARNTGSPEIFEKAAFLESVMKIYRSISDKRFMTLDGTAGPEKILGQIKKDISDNFC